MNPINKKLTGLSRVLRQNMTKEEKHLWYDFLKKLPQIVHRQKVIGNYIVDFYCAEAKLVIELDGTQHRTKEGMQDDFFARFLSKRSRDCCCAIFEFRYSRKF